MTGKRLECEAEWDDEATLAAGTIGIRWRFGEQVMTPYASP